MKQASRVFTRQRLISSKKISAILPFQSAPLPPPPPPPELERKKGLSRRIHWRFNKKAKCLIAFAIIAVLLISCFALLYKPSGSKGDVVVVFPPSNSTATATPSPTITPTSTPQPIASPTPSASATPQATSEPKPPGIIGSAQTINSTVWKKVAATAWAFFQPANGVDPKTGLPYAGGTNFADFTDWDLGVYIQTVIDAEKIGVVGTEGPWGSTARIDKVLTFLENRPLNATTHYPYQFYDSTNGNDDSINSYSSGAPDTVDTGVLFVALNNLRNFNSSLSVQINDIVLNGTVDPNGGSNYTALLPAIEGCAGSNSIYAYLFTSGFASFWPDQVGYVPNEILDNIVNSPTVVSPYGNVTLPEAPIICDPLLLSVFDLNDSSELTGLMNQVYLAHEAYYNSTGEYVAFSEGNNPAHDYIWEWVVAPNGSTWQITNEAGAYLNVDPVIYTKVAFGFLALYNSTFARNMAAFLEQTLPTPNYGYYTGATNSGDVVSETDSNTNGLIIEAALYAMQK